MSPNFDSSDLVENAVCFPPGKYLDIYVYWIPFFSYNLFSILAMPGSIESKRKRNSRIVVFHKDLQNQEGESLQREWMKSN